MTTIERLTRIMNDAEPCRLGRLGYERERYCHEHYGFVEAWHARPICDLHPLASDPDGAALIGLSRSQRERARATLLDCGHQEATPR